MGEIRISIIGLESGSRPFEVRSDFEGFGVEPWFTPRSPLTVAGTVDRYGEAITVRAVGTARVEETCGRCGRVFERPLEVELLVFADREGADDARMARDLEQEGHLVYHDGLAVDVTGSVREAILLSLPIRPICREDCRGLCPGCGVDLNEEACRCTGTRSDDRWEALRRLKDQQ